MYSFELHLGLRNIFKITFQFDVKTFDKLNIQMSLLFTIMSRIERKYCLIITSYLVELFDSFTLLHIWQNYVCFGEF